MIMNTCIVNTNNSCTLFNIVFGAYIYIWERGGVHINEKLFLYKQNTNLQNQILVYCIYI